MAKSNGTSMLWKVVGTVAASILILCIVAVAATVDLARSNSHDIAALQTEQLKITRFRQEVTGRLRALEIEIATTNTHLEYLVAEAKKRN